MTVSVLTIAGSDPSGGAGIQADLRVFGALGVAGLSAITALTVQNSQGVLAVHPVGTEVLAAQIEAVLTDSDVRAIKIGMLGGAEQVRAVADALRRFRPPNVVLDPVLASTGGVPLLDAAGRAALVSDLLPLCDLVTPNVAELCALTGMPVQWGGERYAAAEWLIQRGARSVLIKGGHLKRSPVDVLIQSNGGFHRWLATRVETAHTHGTGCFVASAVAALLTRGLTLPQAVGEAKELLTEALAMPVVVGAGRGYPDVQAGLERVRLRHAPRNDTRAHRITSLYECLYVLTDPALRPDRSAEEIVRAALDGGAKVVQLRHKALPTPELIALARRLKEMARAAGALLIVNDRVDVALAADADGVHLGPDDMSPREARRLLGPDRLVGVSVSTVEEARPVAPYADYLGVGAIFGSSTKDDAGPPVGVERIREIRAAFPEHPIVAIGGINAANIGAVGQAGAAAAAVVSAVVCAPDMRAATEDLLRRFRAGVRGRTAGGPAAADTTASGPG